MKLDRSVIRSIVDFASNLKSDTVSAYQFVNFLDELDLVFKSGDSSQSTLVENKVECDANL